jgi:dCTP deaminase
MFWGRNEWEACSDDLFPINPRNPKRYDEAGYRLSIGHEVFLPEANGSEPRRLERDETFQISAGQFAFIITEEVVTLPLDKIAFISVRAGYKFYGLVNVSGFHVDPGYKGKLIFAVFNSGPSRISLQRGEDVFAIWLAELKSQIAPENAPKKSYYKIESSIINKIDGYHLTAYQVDKKIEEVRNIAKDNQDDLRKYRVYGGVALIIFTVIIFPLLKPSIDFYIAPFVKTQESSASPD